VAEIPLGNDKVILRQTTDYPWSGHVRLEVLSEASSEWELKLRVPGWSVGDAVPSDLYRYLAASGAAPQLTVNGEPVRLEKTSGFAGLARTWKLGDVVEWELPMPIRRVVANEKVAADTGLVALERGPLVYCVEGADENGYVSHLVLGDDVALTAERCPSLLGGVTVLRGQVSGTFRLENGSAEQRQAELTAVPYQVWCHRGADAMAVWLPRTADKSVPLPRPTLAGTAKALASHTAPGDTLGALNDQIVPARSGDTSISRFTWWDHKGSTEWVQYDFPHPVRVGAMEVYWFDDEGKGSCRVPQSYKLTWYDGSLWHQMEKVSGTGVEKDRFNRVTFDPVTLSSLRLETQLKPGFSGGILEWRVFP
jgi:hypothetical protein